LLDEAYATDDQLSADISKLKNELTAEDADGREAFTKKLEEATATLNEAIQAVQKSLDETKAVLEAMDTQL